MSGKVIREAAAAMRVKLTVLAMVVVVAGCKKADAPAPPNQQQAGPQAAQPTTWKVQPTPLSIIKADPPSYVEKPTLVFVAIKPSDYFNFGYQDARNSHFAFEMRSVLEGGRIGPDKLYGYAARSWARPFFERLTNQLQGGKYEYWAATLVVAYDKKRYSGDSAEHIEILAAELDEKFDMDPAPIQERLREEQQKREEVLKRDAAVQTAEQKKCPDAKLLEIFRQQCLGQFAMGTLFGGGRPQFDIDYFCRCAAHRVNLKHVRESTENCEFINTGDLAEYLSRNSTVLACRR